MIRTWLGRPWLARPWLTKPSLARPLPAGGQQQVRPRRRAQTRASLLVLALTAGLALPWLRAQQPDPLTSDESDQVRNTADRLDKRVELLLGFAQQRLDRFQALHAGHDIDRESLMHSMLEQYSAILRETEDNVDDLVAGKVTGEMSKPVKPAKPLAKFIATEKLLLASLQQIQSASTAVDLANYRFELDDALDITKESLDDAQKDLADVQAESEAAKHHKKPQVEPQVEP